MKAATECELGAGWLGQVCPDLPAAGHCTGFYHSFPTSCSVMVSGFWWLSYLTTSPWWRLHLSWSWLHQADIALPIPGFLANRLLFILQNIDCMVTRSGMGVSHCCCWDSLVLPEVCVVATGWTSSCHNFFFCFNSLFACASLCS